jgi:hypothetical protein
MTVAADDSFAQPDVAELTVESATGAFARL